MIALIQRVNHASVDIQGKKVAEIKTGLLVLLGVEKSDNQKNAQDLIHKVINYRVFEDNDQRMNLSLLDIDGSLLIVPQFTLPANTNKGMRPSFTSAAPPEQGQLLYQYFVDLAKNKINNIQTGKFGENMQISLCNNGPVTFWLQK